MKLLSSLPITLLMLAQLAGEGLGAVCYVDPPSGSVIANFEGTVNASTMSCNVTNEQGLQISTQWTLQNFGGHGSQLLTIASAPEFFLVSGDPTTFPSITYQNRLVVLSLSIELDAVVVYCGAGEQLQQANFTLRIYRPPNLQDNVVIKIEENTQNVSIDLHQDPAPFPVPTVFIWYKNGQQLSISDIGLNWTYSIAIFNTISRVDAGHYAVSATNFGKGQQIGNDSGGFHLDVIYGPSFEDMGPTQQYMLLGNSLSLVCGTGLDSNPQATITWTAPDGTVVVNSAQYHYDNGPTVVRLNFTKVISSNIGVWGCDVTVKSEKYIVSNERLVLEEESVIGSSIHHSIQLIAVIAPGQPQMLTVMDIRTTSAFIEWSPPSEGNSPISHYLINVIQIGSSGRVSVVNSMVLTSFNMTGLLPGTTYELTVVAVSQGGNVIARSQPSNSVTITTRFSAPILLCDSTISSNGTISVAWSYLHTGGLTNVSVVYLFTEGSTVNLVPVNVSNIHTTSVSIHGLTTGFKYTINITARNSIGTSSVQCGPILHAIGQPVVPNFGELISGRPNTGEVSIAIKTVASGVNSSQHRFRFVITPIANGVKEKEMEFPFPNYQSGNIETVLVQGLQPGKNYIFSGVAVNIFGRSEPAYSASIFLEGEPLPFKPPVAASTSISAIIGGVIGSLLLVLIILLIALLVTLISLRKKKRKVVTMATRSSEQQ